MPVPALPSNPSMPRATPYSVTEVPRMGIVSVADMAACRAVVPLAMIRSTPWETKLLTMVVQLLVSPEAFWGSKVTLSPSSSVRASWKPWVAWSSATCCCCWTMPMV